MHFGHAIYLYKLKEVYAPSSNRKDLEQESIAPKPTPLILHHILPLNLTHSFYLSSSSSSLHHLKILPICLLGHPLCHLQTHSRHSSPLPQN